MTVETVCLTTVHWHEYMCWISYAVIIINLNNPKNGHILFTVYIKSKDQATLIQSHNNGSVWISYFQSWDFFLPATNWQMQDTGLAVAELQKVKG